MGVVRGRVAAKGAVCTHCWSFWRQQPGHDPAQCRGAWQDSDSPNGLTACMCACTRPATTTTT